MANSCRPGDRALRPSSKLTEPKEIKTTMISSRWQWRRAALINSCKWVVGLRDLRLTSFARTMQPHRRERTQHLSGCSAASWLSQWPTVVLAVSHRCSHRHAPIRGDHAHVSATRHSAVATLAPRLSPDQTVLRQYRSHRRDRLRVLRQADDYRGGSIGTVIKRQARFQPSVFPPQEKCAGRNHTFGHPLAF